MVLKVPVAAIALAAVLALVAAPAFAQDGQAKKKKTVVMNRDHTVQVSRDEDGRTRTRIIIQKRSYLDPGTETFPGERWRSRLCDAAQSPRRGRPRQHGHSAPIRPPLPGPWTLPSKNNPWLGY